MSLLIFNQIHPSVCIMVASQDLSFINTHRWLLQEQGKGTNGFYHDQGTITQTLTPPLQSTTLTFRNKWREKRSPVVNNFLSLLDMYFHIGNGAITIRLQIKRNLKNFGKNLTYCMRQLEKIGHMTRRNKWKSLSIHSYFFHVFGT